MSESQRSGDSAETTPPEAESLPDAPSAPKEIVNAALASGFQDILGYLNFSGGKPDVKFQDRLNRCHPEWGWPNPWESFETALLSRLGELEATSAAFKDSSQARAVLKLTFHDLWLLKIGVAEMKQQVPVMLPIRRPEIVERQLEHRSRLRRILERRRRRFEFTQPREQRRLKRLPRIRPTPFGMTAIQPILKFHIRLAAGEIQIAQNVLKPAGQRRVHNFFRGAGSVRQ